MSNNTTVKLTPNQQINVGDRVSTEVTVYPKWWQFWRTPRHERRWFTVTWKISQ